LIDYVKILLSNIDTMRLLLLSNLDFKTAISKQTGELGTKQIAKYHHCKITLFDSGLLLFTGSIHKLYNSLHNIKAPNYKNGKEMVEKGYNGTQFTLGNILEVRAHLTKLFDCEPQQMQFQNIEFGINTEPSINPQDFIKGLLYQRGKQFEFRFNNCYAQAEHQRYLLKIYNKSNQYGMDKHTLRIETKEIKAESFSVTGIRTFADINTQTLENAKQLLLKRFDKVVYYDYTINKKGLTKRQKQSLSNYSNPRYWFENISVKNRDYHKQILSENIQNHSSNLHQQVRAEIITKFGIINRLSESSKFGIINSSSIELNIPNNTDEKPPTKNEGITRLNTYQKLRIENKVKPIENRLRCCLVTGLNISMQKEGSILLSHTGLRYYLKTDKKVFDEVAYLYLSKKWKYSDTETQIKELAHNIRNKHNNTLIKQIRLYNPSQTRLF